MANKYDEADIVRRVFLMNAQGLKFASYLVRDMGAKNRGIDRFGKLQHHLTYVPVSKFGETMLVNEIGATVYMVLDDDRVTYLQEVVAKVEKEIESGTFEARTFFDLGAPGTLIEVYPHPTTGKPDMIITAGFTVLGVVSLTIAKMFCTLAQNARDGAPSQADSTPPVSQADPVAGEINKCQDAPEERIDPAALDAAD